MHAEADAEERNFIFAGVLNGVDHTCDAALAETARDQNAIVAAQTCGGSFGGVAMGKIKYIPGMSVLLKAAKIREIRFPKDEVFLTAVCRSLGDMAQLGGIAFLRDIVEETPRSPQQAYSLALRLEAVQALTRISGPYTLSFLKGLIGEKDSQLREALQKMESKPLA